VSERFTPAADLVVGGFEEPNSESKEQKSEAAR